MNSNGNKQIEIYDNEENHHVSNCFRLPSDCKCSTVNWIWARIKNRHPNSLDSDLKLINNELDINESSTGIDESTKVGKWMLFPFSNEVIDIWLTIRDLLVEGKLGDCCKVSPRADQVTNKHLIC